MLLLVVTVVLLLLLWCPHRAVEAVVTEHPAGVAGIALVHRGHRGEGGGGLMVGAGVLTMGIVVIPSLCLDPSLVLAVQQLVKILDVAHSVAQDLDLGHLLHGGYGRNVLSKDVKALIEVLHPVSLSLVSLDCFETLSGLDFVSVNGMDDLTRFGRHVSS